MNAPATAPQQPGTVIKGLSCPNCAGTLTPGEGMNILRCPFCDVVLQMLGHHGVRKFHVGRKISKSANETIVQKWLGGWKKAGDLAKAAKITESFLVYIPFWRISADAVGWVFGREKHERQVKTGDTYRTEVYWTDEEREINRHYETNAPACRIEEFGVKWVDLEGDEIKPVDFEELQEEGMTFQPLSSATDALDAAAKKFKGLAENSARLDEVTFKQVSVVRKRITQVFYPLWVNRYAYKNRTYQVVVDGESGDIAYGKAPGSSWVRAIFATIPLLLLAQAAEALFNAGTADGDNDITIGIWAILGVCAIAFVVAGYNVFRNWGEVVEGTGRESRTTG
jgi:hypothetical protein